MADKEKIEKWMKEAEERSKELKDFNKRRHGDRIREICKMEGITQERLAEVAEIDTKTVSRAVNGESILSGEAVIKIYMKWGYLPDWIYGISPLSKDDDRLYFVDVRDLVQIDGDVIKISIKEHLYEILTKGREIVSELADGDSSFHRGIEEQERLLGYSNLNPNYYSACVNFDEFELISPETEKRDT